MGEDIRGSRYKLQLKIVLSIIITLMVGIVVYTKKLIDETKEQNRVHLQDVTIQMQKSITNKFDMYFRELNYIKNNIVENDILGEDTKNTLLKYRVHEKTFDEVMIVDDQGMGITSQQKSIDISNTSYFKNIKNSNKPRVSDFNDATNMGYDLFLFSVPTQQQEKLTGHIIGINKREILTSDLTTGTYGNGGNAHIINEDGAIVFSLDEKIIGENIYELLSEHSVSKDMSEYKKTLVDSKEGVIELSLELDDLYLGFSNLSYAEDLYVIDTIEEKNIFSNIENTKRILIIIIFAILIIFIIIGLYFSIIQERLRKAAFKDRTTDINNYEKFLLDAKDFISMKRKNKRVLLICFDIDKFKIINDIHGYKMGDKVLKIIAQNLTNNFGKKSVYGRITGDIFALVVETEPDDKEIQMIVDIIRTDVINLKGNKELDYAFNLQTCIGIYIVTDGDSDIKKIVSNADMARIKSKENIYKSYVIFDENMRAEIKLIAKLEKDLYSSIENKELEVYYQPKYNINSGKIVGSEALIRWNHSGMGLISPIRFIPIAEKNRFINKIGQWVFEDVCRSLRKCIDEGIDIVPVAINISRVELYQPTLTKNFQEALKKYDIDPKLIEIEITETTALNNLKFINSKLEEIKELGMKVAMDDFGTGNSNLSNLKDISIDVLKLDRSLLIDIENNDKTEVMVKSIVNLSNSLSMITVCEGVENRSQVDIIRKTGCEIVQGFVFSKPVKEKLYKELLKLNQC